MPAHATTKPICSALSGVLALAVLKGTVGCSFLIPASDDPTEPPPPPPETAVVDPASTVGPQPETEERETQPVVGIWTDANGAGWILTINADGTYTNVPRTNPQAETQGDDPAPAEITILQGSWTYEAGILQLRRETPTVEQLPSMLLAKTTEGIPALTDDNNRLLWLLAAAPRPTGASIPDPQ